MTLTVGWNSDVITEAHNKETIYSLIAQSTRTRNTVNPIRKIADLGSLPINTEKTAIKLYLGDPTLSGTLPPPTVALRALQESVFSYRHNGYGPTVGSMAAREAVAKQFSRPEAPLTADDIILTSGCSHALQMAIEAIANPGDNILIPNPGFPLYTTLCRAQGIQDRAYRLDMSTGLIDLDYLDSLIDKRTKAVVINNPGNPTGVVFPKSHLEAILKTAYRRRLPIIADEIYGDLVYGGAKFHALASLSPKVPIITCDGISKRYMVPGWRLGWIAVHDRYGALTEVKNGIIASSQTIVGPCSLIQGTLPLLLKATPAGYHDYNRAVIAKNAEIFFEKLDSVPGLRPLKPQGAMYMMVKIDPKIFEDEMTFIEGLVKEEAVIIFPGSAFFAPGWIRLVLTCSADVTVEAAVRICDFCFRKLEKKGLLPF